MFHHFRDRYAFQSHGQNCYARAPKVKAHKDWWEFHAQYDRRRVLDEMNNASSILYRHIFFVFFRLSVLGKQEAAGENNFQPIRDNARFWRQMRRFMHVFCTVKSLETRKLRLFQLQMLLYEETWKSTRISFFKIQRSTLKKWGSPPFIIFRASSSFWWLASVHCRRRCNGWWHESVGYLYGIPNGIE